MIARAPMKAKNRMSLLQSLCKTKLAAAQPCRPGFFLSLTPGPPSLSSSRSTVPARMAVRLFALGCLTSLEVANTRHNGSTRERRLVHVE
jgi:hypothetical protein